MAVHWVIQPGISAAPDLRAASLAIRVQFFWHRRFTIDIARLHRLNFSGLAIYDGGAHIMTLSDLTLLKPSKATPMTKAAGKATKYARVPEV